MPNHVPGEFAKHYEVLVAGGGVAGVSAALAAARMGRRVALVEKSILLGGLTTAGLVVGYAPLYDVSGRQIAAGLAEELFYASLRYGPGEEPEQWRRKPNGQWQPTPRFAPMAFVLALDELVTTAGVDVWLDTVVTAAVTEGDRLAGLRVYNKSGAGVLSAGCIVDATGDADVAHLAGAPCETQTNYLSSLCRLVSWENLDAAREQGDLRLAVKGFLTGANFDGSGHPDGARTYDGTRGGDVSEFVLESRRLQREEIARRQQALGPEGRNDLYPVTLATQPDFRTTRRIAGRAVLTDDDAGRHHDDCVAVILDWHNNRDLWELPYGALLPRGLGGLIVAGRCISARDYAWEITRIIPICAQSGEVAGVAAAMAVARDTTPDALAPAELQQALSERGFLLDCRDIPAPMHPPGGLETGERAENDENPRPRTGALDCTPH